MPNSGFDDIRVPAGAGLNYYVEADAPDDLVRYWRIAEPPEPFPRMVIDINGSGIFVGDGQHFPVDPLGSGGSGVDVKTVNGQPGPDVHLVASDVTADAAGAAAAVSSTLTAAIAAKADDSAVVKLTGAQTVNGVKTFGSSPIAPDPASGSQLATKQYVDNLVTSQAAKTAVEYASTSPLPANTYANGTSGLGATLTATGNGALVIDTVTLGGGDAGKRVLIAGETIHAHNGWYVVTTVGTGSVPYVLTRSTDADNASEIGSGYLTQVSATVNPGANDAKVFISVASQPFVVGTTDLFFSPVGGTITAGTGLNLSGTTLSVIYGTTAGTATQGNDSRNSNARTPTAHAATHAPGGTDPLSIDQADIVNLVDDIAALQSEIAIANVKALAALDANYLLSTCTVVPSATTGKLDFGACRQVYGGLGKDVPAATAVNCCSFADATGDRWILYEFDSAGVPQPNVGAPATAPASPVVPDKTVGRTYARLVFVPANATIVDTLLTTTQSPARAKLIDISAVRPFPSLSMVQQSAELLGGLPASTAGLTSIISAPVKLWLANEMQVGDTLHLTFDGRTILAAGSTFELKIFLGGTVLLDWTTAALTTGTRYWRFVYKFYCYQTSGFSVDGHWTLSKPGASGLAISTTGYEVVGDQFLVTLPDTTIDANLDIQLAIGTPNAGSTAAGGFAEVTKVPAAP